MTRARNRLSIITVLAICASLCLSLGLSIVWVHTAPVAQAQGTTVVVGDTTIAVNQSGSVDIWVRGFPAGQYGLGAYWIRIDYNSALTRIDSVSPGDPPFNAPMWGPEPLTDGYINIAQYSTAWPGPTGDIRVATLNLTCLSAGKATLKLTIYTLANVNGDYVNATPISGTVNRPALTVTTNAATNAGSNSATLEGTLNSLAEGSSSAAVSFQWGLDTSYGYETTSQALTGPAAFSASISGLSYGTTYHYRAKAVGNTTVYGSDVTFTTTTPVLSVTTNAATNLGTTSATLNGNLTDLGTASSAAVSFLWGPSASYGYQTTAQTLTTTGVFAASITGLSPGTIYYFVAKAVGNTTAYGYNMSLTTATVVTPTPTPTSAPTLTPTPTVTSTPTPVPTPTPTPQKASLSGRRLIGLIILVIVILLLLGALVYLVRRWSIRR